jgi:hypothetical protein
MRVAIVRLRLEQPGCARQCELPSETSRGRRDRNPRSGLRARIEALWQRQLLFICGRHTARRLRWREPQRVHEFFAIVGKSVGAHGPKDPKVWVLPDDVKGQPYPSPGPWPQTVLLMYGRVKQLTPNAADSAMSFPGRFFCSRVGKWRGTFPPVSIPPSDSVRRVFLDTAQWQAFK